MESQSAFQDETQAKKFSIESLPRPGPGARHLHQIALLTAAAAAAEGQKDRKEGREATTLLGIYPFLTQ